MRIDIVNADIVTGDGTSYLDGSSVVIEDGLITDVPRVPYIAYNFYAHRVINARGGIVMPGLINTHAHAITFGPTMVWGWQQIPRERILQNLDTHLLQGSTTLMNLDGWVMPHETEASNTIHPINVRQGTLHTPKNVIQSEIESGQRIQEPHRSYTAAEAVASGAIAIGEVGSPATSFGTYEKSRRLGRVISPRDAQPVRRRLHRGRLGRVCRTAVTRRASTTWASKGRRSSSRRRASTRSRRRTRRSSRRSNTRRPWACPRSATPSHPRTAQCSRSPGSSARACWHST